MRAHTRTSYEPHRVAPHRAYATSGGQGPRANGLKARLGQARLRHVVRPLRAELSQTPVTPRPGHARVGRRPVHDVPRRASEVWGSHGGLGLALTSLQRANVWDSHRSPVSPKAGTAGTSPRRGPGFRWRPGDASAPGEAGTGSAHGRQRLVPEGDDLRLWYPTFLLNLLILLSSPFIS